MCFFRVIVFQYLLCVASFVDQKRNGYYFVSSRAGVTVKADRVRPEKKTAFVANTKNCTITCPANVDERENKTHTCIRYMRFFRLQPCASSDGIRFLLPLFPSSANDAWAAKCSILVPRSLLFDVKLIGFVPRSRTPVASTTSPL